MEKEIFNKRTRNNKIIQLEDIKNLLENYLYEYDLSLDGVYEGENVPFPIAYNDNKNMLFMNYKNLIMLDTKNIFNVNMYVLFVLFHEFRHIYQNSKNDLSSKIYKYERQIMYSNYESYYNNKDLFLCEYNANFSAFTKIQAVYNDYYQNDAILKLFYNFLIDAYKDESPIEKISKILDYEKLNKEINVIGLDDYKKLENGLNIDIDKIKKLRIDNKKITL